MQSARAPSSSLFVETSYYGGVDGGSVFEVSKTCVFLFFCLQIKLSCGSSDELISVTEPNRCEYSMEFRTLALCEDLSEETHDLHEEL